MTSEMHGDVSYQWLESIKERCGGTDDAMTAFLHTPEGLQALKRLANYGHEHTTKDVCRFERMLQWLHAAFHTTELDGLTDAEAESATKFSNILIAAVAKSLHEQPGDSVNGKVLIAGIAGFLRIFKSKMETPSPRTGSKDN
jgi:hypothetical protein